jgi:hypothetical protein
MTNAALVFSRGVLTETLTTCTYPVHRSGEQCRRAGAHLRSSVSPCHTWCCFLTWIGLQMCERSLCLQSGRRRASLPTLSARSHLNTTCNTFSFDQSYSPSFALLATGLQRYFIYRRIERDSMSNLHHYEAGKPCEPQRATFTRQGLRELSICLNDGLCRRCVLDGFESPSRRTLSS